MSWASSPSTLWTCLSVLVWLKILNSLWTLDQAGFKPDPEQTPRRSLIIFKETAELTKMLKSVLVKTSETRDKSRKKRPRKSEKSTPASSLCHTLTLSFRETTSRKRRSWRESSELLVPSTLSVFWSKESATTWAYLSPTLSSTPQRDLLSRTVLRISIHCIWDLLIKTLLLWSTRFSLRMA